MEDPVVSSSSIGFYNAAEQTLKFVLFVGGTSRVVTMQPHQIATFDVETQADLRGVLNTDGNTSSGTPLNAGELYVLRAEAGRWVFAKL
ncbi:hypothetical protein BRAO375_4300008 [Bradyrhizobium sp. ORS 375]|nr:hypothetical protein BRAO375_4300008 [Bradyrhizobium sp. ORS 375]